MNSVVDPIIHLTEIALSHVSVADVLALIGALFYVATLLVRTIVPLRTLAIVSMLFFIAYGAVAGAAATLLLYLASLPINVVRLGQMLNLNKKARISAQGDLSMDWLRPYMTPKRYRRGEVLCRKGDLAKEMYFVVTGKFMITELGIEITPGIFMGELGFVASDSRRTQTIECIENSRVLTLSYEKLLELFFQNPEFGYAFSQLTSGRLIQNLSRLEDLVAARTGQSTHCGGASHNARRAGVSGQR
jgi:CRP-like cAMP-binding protein